MPTDAVKTVAKGSSAGRRDWCSRKEAAEALKISLDTLDRWIEGGRIQALQPGGPGTQLRIMLEELERVKRRERGAA